jgi:hypothetical protein
MDSIAYDRRLGVRLMYNGNWDYVLDALISNKDDNYGDHEREEGMGIEMVE